ncbi:MAG: response regulator [Magnetococcus sp. THC-1_WYH]
MLSMEKGRILIVDDIRINVKFLVQSLKPDYELFVADNGLRALELAALERPDLVLLDIMMPGMDGYEVCRRLKADEKTQNIGILFMTAKDGDHDEAKCFEAGAVDVITKPYHNAVVRAKVKNHIELKRYRDFTALEQKKHAEKSKKLKQASEIATSLEGVEFPDIPGIAFRDGLQQWGDLEVYKMAIADFIHDHAADGTAIRLAILAGHRDKTVAMTHALKGGAGTIRALELAKAAATLERALLNNETIPESLLQALDTSLLMLAHGEKLLRVEKNQTHQQRQLPPPTEHRSAQYKILVVDDESVNLKLLREILHDEYELIFAKSGQEMLQHVLDGPDLILLDIMMPGMDGYECCIQLKANPETRDIPVIFISSMTDVMEEVRGFASGAIDYISKPVKAAVVRARIKTHLTLKESLKTIVHQNLEIKKKNEELLEANRIREDIDQIVRHDLKGPLNFVIGAPSLLVEDLHPGPDQLKLFREIEASGFRMLAMINRSHDLYKMERGLYKLNPIPVDMIAVINRVTNELQSILAQKGLTLTISIDNRRVQGDETFFILGEELLCHAMFSNIIKNAMEASPEKESVEIFLRRSDQAHIGITNKGEIPPEIRETFFHKYVTAGKSHGTGLGTYSAQLSAKTMAGDIRVDFSQEGKTTIAICLPLKKG